MLHRGLRQRLQSGPPHSITNGVRPQRPLARLPLVLVLVLSATSIASLLLYFYGLLTMRQGVQWVVLPAMGLWGVLLLWARQACAALYHRVLAGLWAGALATLLYDLVRLPIAWSGVPVFKAIVYFGTVIVGTSQPTVLSEIIGWLYHLSNGVGFGVMYVMLVATPRWWTALLWGLALEGAMLLTPYAEVFGYQLSGTFLAITIGAHMVYGVTLWTALRAWQGPNALGRPAQLLPRHLILTTLLVPLSLGAFAADFHGRYAATLPPSPPGYLGPHLYTTWQVLEPDRLAAMWVLQRFVDPQAQFHWIPPFSSLLHGTPFDTPEATIRRSGTRSATEQLLVQYGLEHDARLRALARMTHLYEITPWMRPADPVAQHLGHALLRYTRPCAPPVLLPCVQQAFQHLDAWYAQPESL